MTKDEFKNLSPYKQFLLMKKVVGENIGSTEKQNQKYIQILTQWFKEVLEEKYGIVDVPRYGLVKLEDVESMGLDIDTGALKAEPIEREYRNPVTKEKVKETVWVCRKANQFFEKRYQKRRKDKQAVEELVEEVFNDII